MGRGYTPHSNDDYDSSQIISGTPASAPQPKILVKYQQRRGETKSSCFQNRKKILSAVCFFLLTATVMMVHIFTVRLLMISPPSPLEAGNFKKSGHQIETSKGIAIAGDSDSKAKAALGAASAKETKPIFILHIGPPKTGSTTLQCELESLRIELAKDGYHYIGRPECPGSVVDIKQMHKNQFRIFAKALVTSYDCHRQLQHVSSDIDTSIQVLSLPKWKPTTLTNLVSMHCNVGKILYSS